jgi:Spy/CpxP family protein refolding chaperone
VSEERVTVRKLVHVVQYSQEAWDDAAAMPSFEEIQLATEADRARFNALTPEQQSAELAEAAAKREAECLERTCPHCGCDPYEHGSY